MHPSIQRARRIATLMDSRFVIPIIRKRFGLDALLGLVPGGGDAIAAIISAYVLVAALELNLPPHLLRPLMARMILNLVLDFLVGSVPVVGDVMDVFWKANMRNIRLLEEAYQAHQRSGFQPTIDVPAEPVRRSLFLSHRF
jgi:hypothetical protein